MVAPDLAIYGICVIPKITRRPELSGTSPMSREDFITGLSAASLVGRLLGGVIADGVGCFDTFIASLFSEMVVLVTLSIPSQVGISGF